MASFPEQQTGGSTPHNFGLNFSHVRKIIYILEEDPAILAEWTRVKDIFLDKPVDRFGIERKIHEGRTYEAMVQTLNLWISQKASEATFEDLLHYLKEYRATVEKLKQSTKEIKKS